MTKKEFDKYVLTLSDEDKKHVDEIVGLNLNKRPIVAHFKRANALKEHLSEDKNIYLYQILGVSIHTETQDLLVVYQALYDDEKTGVKSGDLFARPIEMSIDKVDKEKYPDVTSTYRFELE